MADTDGKVVYEIVGDDSQLGKDLDQVETKIKKKAKGAEDAVKQSAKGASSEVGKAASDGAKDLGKMDDAARDADKALDHIDAGGIDDAGDAARDAEKQVDQFGDAARDAEKQVDEVAKSSDEAAEQIEQVGEQSKKAAKHVDGLGNSGDKASGKLKGLASGGLKVTGAAMAAVGAAAVALGTKAVTTAVDMDQAMGQFFASTGIAAKQTMTDTATGVTTVIDNMAKYQGVMEDIYANNYGESFDDIAQAMATVKQQMADLPDDQLQGVTESAFALRDVFGYEVTESVRAAQSMVTQFGISGDDALDLITQGAQNGLDYSGELLDSINEYSPQFKKLGLDAEAMFNIFDSGMEAGAFNLDKIGDAVKEFSIRAIDGSETSAEGFRALGLDADATAAKIAAGGDGAKEAFGQVISGLAAMEDPVAQSAAGVALFGTMWEDLGPDVVTQLDAIGDGIYANNDALDQLKTDKYDNLGSALETLKRKFDLLLGSLGESLIPVIQSLAESVFPALESVFPPLMEQVGQLVTQLAPLVADFLPVLIELASQLMPPLMQLAETCMPIIVELLATLAPLLGQLLESVLPVLVELLDTLLPPILEIVSTLLPPLLELLNALMPILSLVIDLLGPIIDLFARLMIPIASLISGALTPLLNILTPIISTLTSLLIPALELVGSVFESVFGGVLTAVEGALAGVQQALSGVINFVTGIFTGNWERAWNGVKNIFSGIVSGLGSIFKTPINAIIDGINGFIRGLNRIQIPDWVPLVGGRGFHIGTIPRLRVGMDYVPSDDFPALLHRGEAVLTEGENRRYRSLGGIDGIEAVLAGGWAASAPQEPSVVVNVTSPVYLDGKDISKSVTDHQYNDVKLRRY